jgi:putative DNA methylase
MTTTIISPRKLIEVALPLAEINEAAAKEKSIRHGHPSTLHLWWARRPLAAARAVIFAQMVNDPSWKYSEEELAKSDVAAKVEAEREKLFGILRELVKWENTTNEAVLEPAREEIRKSWRETCSVNKAHPEAATLFDPEKLPAFHDPFAGGGALPLEAQRLGLEAWASDLNPVAVLINKAMIEIPPKFAGRAPVGPESKGGKGSGLFDKWPGASGLAEDVRRYGAWMRDEAQKRIGHLYPKVKGPEGEELTVIAWIWARTVKSPNPAFSHVDVPLMSTFFLSTKKDKQVWLEPLIDGDSYAFKIRKGKPENEAALKTGTKLSRGGNFKCVLSGTMIEERYIKSEALQGRMGAKLLVIVAEGRQGREYLASTVEHERIAYSASPTWKPDLAMPENPRWFSPPGYGLLNFADIFTPRQLVALSTFSDLIGEVREKIYRDALKAGMTSEGKGLEEGGSGARAYADAVAVYLSFAVDKTTDLNNSLSRWESIAQCPRQLFGRQAIPMVWDFAEANVLSDSSGSWNVIVEGISKAFAKSFGSPMKLAVGNAIQADAVTQSITRAKIVSTDPPYYDNIGYADLSDFFYIWLRRSLATVFPALLSTFAVPKAEELVATPYRHGSKEKADGFFLAGMTRVIRNVYNLSLAAAPVTIYYAFKQGERVEQGAPSTGWETFLNAVITAGYSIVGTWPLRTENASRLVGQDTNALASSVVLVCRRREDTATTTTRKAFLAELRRSLKSSKATLTAAHLAPVDLAQSLIGPGMAAYSKYAKILEPDGSSMTVHTALALINREIGGDWDFDPSTHFCMDWYLQYAFEPGEYGQAELLSKAKNVDVKLLSELGLLVQKGGKVTLVQRSELGKDELGLSRSGSLWEALQRLVQAIRTSGEAGTASLLKVIKVSPEDIRDLAYELYTLCDRKGGVWREEAGLYNQLIVSWSEITKLEASMKDYKAKEGELDFEADDDSEEGEEE